MRPWFRLAATTGTAFIVTGCATLNVSSHVQRGLDLTQYRTFAWGTADALPAADPRLDRDPSFTDCVRRAVEKQLAAQGFARASSESADLLIHYHASVTTRIDANRVDGYSGGDDGATETSEYEAATLVLDVLDARTNRVIWRGWAQDAVEKILDNPDKMERRVEEAVTRMFASFPGPIADASREGGRR